MNLCVLLATCLLTQSEISTIEELDRKIIDSRRSIESGTFVLHSVAKDQGVLIEVTKTITLNKKRIRMDAKWHSKGEFTETSCFAADRHFHYNNQDLPGGGKYALTVSHPKHVDP